MMPRGRRLLRWGVGITGSLVLAALVGLWVALRASQPRIEGEVTATGLGAPVVIERDTAGVPVIRGASRADVAHATGYVHAQDRWFQMDLLRRSGAGELAALLGPGLLERDRQVRIHQFRKRARATLAALPVAQRKLLAAYAAGANAALAAARARPFEYLLLGLQPVPWRAEDSLLVGYAQWIDLQGLENLVEQQNGRLAAALPASLYRLIVEPDPAWEAPLDGSRLHRPSLPTSQEYDLRRIDPALFDRIERLEAPMPGLARSGDAVAAAGSNNWALAGTRTADGGALLANDMHLRLRVPNVWYRARLVVEPEEIDITGVTLPGTPVLIAGSNGHVAWGFTNSYGDFQDLVVLEPAGSGGEAYLTAEGPRAIEQELEWLDVAGGVAEQLVVRKTVWGPVIGRHGSGRELALAWTAHRPGATDLRLMSLERARDLDTAAEIMAGAGMPAQNVMLADRAGRIGWVLSGRLPIRRGFDPDRPAAWHADGAGWHGWYPRAESPRLLDPPGGAGWSANARVVGGEAWARLGDGSYAPAARARQIRARLDALAGATAADLLAIQLDDRADYLAHWQPVLAAALGRIDAAEAGQLVRDWSGRAAIEDPGFRLLREFERRVVERCFTMLAIEAAARWPAFAWRAPQRFTETAWRLLNERPANLLDPRFADWDAWLDAIARETVDDLPPDCATLADCSWGRVNTAAIRHPISFSLPALSRWLDMPTEPLPGDWSTPRVQSPVFGASERFVVSPGREQDGYFHMPGGQSGHPLSPYYRAGHEAWARGEPAPFLPGPAKHVLRIDPAR